MTKRLLNFTMKILITLTFWCCYYCKADFQSDLAMVSEKTLPEDGRLNFTQLANKYGHKAEEHDIVTEDRYILTAFRIPGKKSPVLLFHGLLDSADTFVLRGHKSLAVTLANAGYDVWVGNNRGNRYARRHVRLDPDTDMQFWDYSFHETGFYDLAGTIDFIRSKTGHDSIPVIGHSQGTTAQFVLASLRPEYNARIKISIALAPGVFYNNPVFPVSTLTSMGPMLDSLIPLDVQEIVRDHQTFSDLIKFICSKGVVSYVMCGYGLIFPFAGFDTAGLDSGFLGIVIGHFPAASSRKSLRHYDQVFLRKSFSQYDYGVTKNMAKYGAAEPPEYNLTAVTMPAALLVGKNDHFVTMKDVKHLRDILPNVVHYEVMEPELWNHLDFVWGSQMPKYLFPSILNILEKYSSQNGRDSNQNFENSGKNVENRCENSIDSRNVDVGVSKGSGDHINNVNDCVQKSERLAISRFIKNSPSGRLRTRRYRGFRLNRRT